MPRTQKFGQAYLKSVRAYLLKEEFQLFWDYESPAWAAKYLDAWCIRAMRSRIEPVKNFARTVRTHRDLHQATPRKLRNRFARCRWHLKRLSAGPHRSLHESLPLFRARPQRATSSSASRTTAMHSGGTTPA